MTAEPPPLPSHSLLFDDVHLQCRSSSYVQRHRHWHQIGAFLFAVQAVLFPNDTSFKDKSCKFLPRFHSSPVLLQTLQQGLVLQPNLWLFISPGDSVRHGFGHNLFPSTFKTQRKLCLVARLNSPPVTLLVSGWGWGMPTGREIEGQGHIVSNVPVERNSSRKEIYLQFRKRTQQ